MRLLNTIIVCTVLFVIHIAAESTNVIFPECYWKDINLFYGTQKYPNASLINIISRCKTVIGKCALAKMLAGGQSNDIETIKHRQKIIETLGYKKNLLSLLDRFRSHEDSLLSFFDPKSQFYDFKNNTDIIKKFYYTDRNNANKGYRQLLLRKLLTSDFYNIFLKQYNNGLSLVCYVASYLLEDEINPLFLIAQFIPIPLFREGVNIFGLIKLISRMGAFNVSKLFSSVFFICGIITTIFSYKKILNRYKAYKTTLKQVLDKVVDLQVLIDIIIELQTLLSDNPQTKELIIHINQLLEQEDAGNDLLKLLGAIKTIDFNDVRYLSKNSVVALSLFRIFYDHKTLFANIIDDVAMIDMWYGISQLMKEGNDNACYCYTNIIDRPKPYVCMKALWNPFINQCKVITNDIIIGDDFTNLILCGHNGGGKSTYLKALIIAILLSQTFGIAPAKNMTMTLFKYIRIMSSVSEEFSDSDSLFTSEIKRLRDYINLCKTVKDNEFICTVFDEPLRGTDSTSAIILLKSIFKYLSGNNKLLHVISTHYRDIISLEDENREKFRNYLVDVKFFDDNNFEYTYKIIPGKAQHSIALNIAAKKGLDKDVISLAKKEQTFINPFVFK